MKLLSHTLPNGLEIVAECNAAAYSTALGFFVRTGSRDENDAMAGVSHFLEHMAFKGTPSRSADDVNREFDEMGAHYNAFTNEENTVFYAAVLPEHQDRAVELLADILRPSLREDDFDTEKQVILEEIQMYEDQPPFGADDKCPALALRFIRWAAACWAPPRASRPDGRGDARLFSAALQPGQHRAGRDRPIDFDRWWPPRAALRRLAAPWRPAETWNRPPPATAFKCWQGDGHAAVRACSLPPDRPPRTPTAMPPNCWPPCWATTRAAGSIGNWSIPAWPNM